MPDSVYFIDPITGEYVILKYEERAYPYFASINGAFTMMYSTQEDDWIIKEESEVKFRWKTNWPVTGIVGK